MEEHFEIVGRKFVEYYYHLFDNERAKISTLYLPNSALIFEGQKIEGNGNISCKLNGLPFDQCKHVISTVDSQPSSPTGSIVVFVSGSIQLPGEDHSLRFSQMFHLVPLAQGNFVIQNDIFRLNYI